MSKYHQVPSLGTARVATDLAHYLAEGPVWDPIRERVLWVDIEAGAVHSGRLTAEDAIDRDDVIEIPDTAGAVAVAESGDLVIAGAHRLYYWSAEGAPEPGAELVSGDARRFNDGKPDPAGRFVVGTKGPGDEILARIDAGEQLAVIDGDLSLSNGLAWAQDGARLYSIDTLNRRIYVRDYDAESGATGARELFAELEVGYPDGMTIDAEGHPWVAVWGEGCVLRFSPTGEIVARVDVPAPHTSCAVFAGPDLDVLIITTAREDLTDEQLDEYPDSGRLFTIRPGVRGTRAALWSGTR